MIRPRTTAEPKRGRGGSGRKLCRLPNQAARRDAFDQRFALRQDRRGPSARLRRGATGPSASCAPTASTKLPSLGTCGPKAAPVPLGLRSSDSDKLPIRPPLHFNRLAPRPAPPAFMNACDRAKSGGRKPRAKPSKETLEAKALRKESAAILRRYKKTVADVKKTMRAAQRAVADSRLRAKPE